MNEVCNGVTLATVELGIASLDFTLNGLGISTGGELAGNTCDEEADVCHEVLKLDGETLNDGSTTCEAVAGCIESMEMDSHVWVGGGLQLGVGLALGTPTGSAAACVLTSRHMR